MPLHHPNQAKAIGDYLGLPPQSMAANTTNPVVLPSQEEEKMAKDQQVNTDSKHYPTSVPKQEQKVNVENKSKQSSMPNLEHLLNLFGGGTSAVDGAE